MTTQNFTVDNGITVSGSGGNITGATNIEASGNLIVHDASFGGNINSAGNFDLDGNAQIGGNLFVTGNINFTGNVTQISGNSGVFYGNAQTGSGALYAGKTGYTPVANTVVQITGDLDDYIQVNLQNTNHANTASMEIAITADDGNDTNNYLDMGIASSTWDGTQTNSLGTAVNPRDGYMYVQGGAAGGNLILGATSAGYEIKFNAGGPDAANTVARINNTGLISTGIVSATGNVRGGNINTAGNISGNYVFGNAAFMTGISGGGSYSNSNVTALLAAYGSNIISSTGNITTTGNISGSYILGNAAFMTGIPASYGNANVAANLAAFGSNPILTTGNITGGNINLSANTSNIVFNTTAYISGNGTPLSRDGSIVLQPYTGAGSSFPGVVIGGAGRLLAPNGSVHQIFNAADVTFQVSVKTPAIAATSTTTGGIQAAGGVGVAGSLYAGNVFTPGTLSATGNATFGTSMVIDGANNAITTTNGSALQFGQRVNFNSVNGIYVTGNTNSQSNLIVAGFATTTGNVTGGNLLTGGLISATGNITGNYIFGNGSQLTGMYGNANVTTLLAALGTNVISSTGNITTTANISGGYILGNAAFVTGLPAGYTDANATALLAAFGSNTISTTGNITSGNLLTPGIASAASYIGSVVSVSGNITGGNLNTGAQVVATGNITGGNLITGGLISATSTITSAANITGGNVTTAGLITATSNITGGNLNTGGTVSATGNVTGGNITTAGAISATGNVQGGNLIVAGTTTLTGNITTSGYFISGNQATGGFQLGNVNSRITTGGSNSYVNIGQNISFNPDTALAAGAGVLIGGNGYLLAPNGARVLTLGSAGDVTVNGNINQSLASTQYINTAGQISAAGNLTVSTSITRSGSISQPAWTTSGIGLKMPSATYTDSTTATGTQASSYIHTVSAPQFAFANTVTVTNAATLFVAEPTAGIGATLTNKWAILANGAVSVTGTVAAGNLTTSGTVSATGNINAASNINISAGSLYRSTTNINAATWGNAGIGIVWPALTYNDTTITTGTYASSYIHVMGAPTFNYSTFVTINNAATLYVEKPIPGNNATLGNAWAILASGNISVTGNVVTPNVTATTITATTLSATNVNLTGNIGGNTNGYTIGYLNIPQVVASGNATFGLNDAGKHYYANAAGNITLTIPNNVTTGFPIGTAISIVVQANTNVSVNVATAGVSLYLPGNSTSGNRTITPYSMATLMKVGTDTWFINGTGVS